MNVYETTHLVEQRDLNHHGTLFAAVMAGWFVEAGFICACSAHGSTADVVCIGIDAMRFNRPVKPGTLLQLRACLCRAGITSLTVEVKGYDSLDGEGGEIVTGKITFVTIDETTRVKKPHGIIV